MAPAQDPSNLNGKVLHVGPDGYPIGDSPIVSLGHRNPQGIALRPDGLVLAVEHGTDVNDEINVIEPGGNYGYPCFTGVDDPGPMPEGCAPASAYLPPAWASGSPTLATSGATFLSGGGWGDWEGSLIVSTLKEEDLRRFSVDQEGVVTFEETLLDRRFGRLRAVVIGPDGALYVTSSNGESDRIIRVTRSG
jgi:glucose/arabinose dehydrogenase